MAVGMGVPGRWSCVRGVWFRAVAAMFNHDMPVPVSAMKCAFYLRQGCARAALAALAYFFWRMCREWVITWGFMGLRGGCGRHA